MKEDRPASDIEEVDRNHSKAMSLPAAGPPY